MLVYPSSLTPTQRRVINLTENVQRVDLTDPEMFLNCKELMALNPIGGRKHLAAHLNETRQHGYPLPLPARLRAGGA